MGGEEVSMRPLNKTKNIVYTKKDVLFDKLTQVFGFGTWTIRYTLPTFYQNEFNKSLNRWEVCCAVKATLVIRLKDKEWTWEGTWCGVCTYVVTV